MNINEIAKMAGVSRATVSRFLNDGYVSEEKRERIRQVIDRTGYTPSLQAQMLRTKKTGQVGVIIPFTNSESISRMISGISVTLHKAGIQMLLANAENSLSDELGYLRLFSENKVDGVILFATVFTREHKKALEEMQVPLVILGQQMEGYPCVYQDDFNAAKEITRTLLDKTTSRVGYIGVSETDEAIGRARKQGFLSAVRERGIDWDESCYVECGFSAEEGYRAAGTLIERHPDISAVLGATDPIALGAMARFQENGRQVPDNVAVAGLGDITLGKMVRPGLTSVHFYYQDSGQEAADILLELMKGNPVKREVKMDYCLRQRGTTRG